MDCNASYICPRSRAGVFEQQFPVGMGYVPWQVWNQTYPLDRAFQIGTIFPELDLRFNHGRCMR